METKTIMTGFCIVVADKGFVYVGNVSYDGDTCTVENAKNIRRWGTSKGLGELAFEGPQESTKLDDYGKITIPHFNGHFIEIKDEGKWK